MFNLVQQFYHVMWKDIMHLLVQLHIYETGKFKKNEVRCYPIRSKYVVVEKWWQVYGSHGKEKRYWKMFWFTMRLEKRWQRNFSTHMGKEGETDKVCDRMVRERWWKKVFADHMIRTEYNGRLFFFDNNEDQNEGGSWRRWKVMAESGRGELFKRKLVEWEKRKC